MGSHSIVSSISSSIFVYFSRDSLTCDIKVAIPRAAHASLAQLLGIPAIAISQAQTKTQAIVVAIHGVGEGVGGGVTIAIITICARFASLGRGTLQCALEVAADLIECLMEKGTRLRRTVGRTCWCHVLTIITVTVFVRLIDTRIALDATTQRGAGGGCGAIGRFATWRMTVAVAIIAEAWHRRGAWPIANGLPNFSARVWRIRFTFMCRLCQGKSVRERA